MGNGSGAAAAYFALSTTYYILVRSFQEFLTASLYPDAQIADTVFTTTKEEINNRIIMRGKVA